VYVYTYIHIHIYIYIFICLCIYGEQLVFDHFSFFRSLQVEELQRELVAAKTMARRGGWPSSPVALASLFSLPEVIHTHTHTHTQTDTQTHTNTHTHMCVYIYI